MKRGVHQVECEDELPRHTLRRKADLPGGEDSQASREAGPLPGQPGGYAEFVSYLDNPSLVDPMERIEQNSWRKEQLRQSQRKDRESQNMQAMITEKIGTRKEKEETILKAFQQMSSLKEYVQSLNSLDKLVRDELMERLKYKNKTRDNFQKKTTDMRQEMTKKINEDTATHMQERKKEGEAKNLLNEIIRLQQNEEEVDRRIEKLKQDHEAAKARMQHDESVVRKAQEKEAIKQKLESLVQRVQEKNSLFAKEYLGVRVLNEQVGRLKHQLRVFAVLVPKENVPNPFQLQAYLRVSKHHRSLSVIHNEKILEPEKHTLTDLDERVGNVEMYAQGVDAATILGESVERGVNRQPQVVVRRQPQKKVDLDVNGIVSLENSDEEDEDAPEILHTTIDLADAAGDSPDDGLQGNAVADSKKLTENATRLAEMLAPDPVRVFNDALVLKKNTKRVAQVSTNSICRFDLIITNDYVSTYFDNNVVLKLYSELELFIKGLFYKSFDKVLQKLSFYSEEYKRILNSDRQRTDLNLHYHTEGRLPDVNALLHNKIASRVQIDARVITRDDFTVDDEEVRRLKFTGIALPGISSTRTELGGSVGWEGSDKNSVECFDSELGHNGRV